MKSKPCTLKISDLGLHYPKDDLKSDDSARWNPVVLFSIFKLCNQYCRYKTLWQKSRITCQDGGVTRNGTLQERKEELYLLNKAKQR